MTTYLGATAMVYGPAVLCGSVVVRGDGLVSKLGDYITCGPAISSGRTTTLHRDAKVGWRVNCGCFTGTVDEFAKAIGATHKGNAAAKAQYLGFVHLFREHIKVMEAV